MRGREIVAMAVEFGWINSCQARTTPHILKRAGNRPVPIRARLDNRFEVQSILKQLGIPRSVWPDRTQQRIHVPRTEDSHQRSTQKHVRTKRLESGTTRSGRFETSRYWEEPTKDRAPATITQPAGKTARSRARWEESRRR
jgi:hypothetical protein